MLYAVLFVGEVGRHGYLVEFNDGIMRNGDFYGLGIADGTGGCFASFIRKGPVITVIGDA